MATNVPNWTELLREAIQTPGMLMQAYTAFHDYSVGNQLLALWQCGQRGLPPGPLNTYPGWQKLGRQVKKGEKALTLLMPVTVKEKRAATVGTDEEGQRFTTFIYKPHWFVLTQTEGAAPAVTINNPQQVNIAADGGQQVNLAKGSAYFFSGINVTFT